MENLFQDEAPEKRIELLETNACRVELDDVKRYFTPEEMEDMRKELSESSIIRNDKEIELKDLTSGLRGEIKVLSAAIKQNLRLLKQKYELTNEKVYLFDDQKEGMMYTLDKFGVVIGGRKLRPEERQTRIMPIIKQG